MIFVFFIILCICSYFVEKYEILIPAWNIVINLILLFLSSILSTKIFFADKIKKYQEISEKLQKEIKETNND